MPRIQSSVCLLAAVLVCGSAAAQDAAKPFDPNSYPAGVQQSLQRARDECISEGGANVTFAPDTVHTSDLTGSGRGDYIVDFRNAECHDIADVYCGSGGCRLDIDVTLPGGDVRAIFSDRVQYYEILPGHGARTIRFELHGSFCGLHGSQLCVKTRRITTKPFKFTMPQ